MYSKTNKMDNITENNKLMAEFMGLETGKQLGYERWENDWFDNRGVINGQRNEKLLFDTDWNWLMEVVGKIQILEIVHDNTRNYDSVFKEWQCTFSPTYKTHDFGYIVGKSKNSEIESVYNACIEFIKWYNKCG